MIDKDDAGVDDSKKEVRICRSDYLKFIFSIVFYLCYIIFIYGIVSTDYNIAINLGDSGNLGFSLGKIVFYKLSTEGVLFCMFSLFYTVYSAFHNKLWISVHTLLIAINVILFAMGVVLYML